MRRSEGFIMIFHKHKLIFIHIPKCAGSSVSRFYAEGKKFNWEEPNYEYLYGWCPERKIHLQHATAKQLLDTSLIDKDIWDNYLKFTIIRNPWDRAYSDYIWLMKDRKIKGSFKSYLKKSGEFKETLTNDNSKNYRGDHLIPQSDFFTYTGKYSIDCIFRFEKLNQSLQVINHKLNIAKDFLIHEKKNDNKPNHYSYFYTKSKKNLVDSIFYEDIKKLGYQFEDKKKGLMILKNII